ncbi:MAG: hypothetical protein PHH08_02050, partial [Candidatus ainarchaeum sp.]|nr:hypothetical protein [Candidatus ainarchaeum sp.]
MRKFFLLVFFSVVLLVFSLSAAALSMESQKKEFVLGDSIVFSGNCSGSSVSARVSIDDKTLFSMNV